MTKRQKIDLINLAEIAELYCVSYRTARDTLTKRRDFPPPIPACTRKSRLWLRESIEAFMRGEKTHA